MHESLQDELDVRFVGEKLTAVWIHHPPCIARKGRRIPGVQHTLIPIVQSLRQSNYVLTQRYDIVRVEHI